jgi:hypothetical protein
MISIMPYVQNVGSGNAAMEPVYPLVGWNRQNWLHFFRDMHRKPT